MPHEMMSATEFSDKLSLYKRYSGEQISRRIAERLGKSPQAINYYKKNGLNSGPVILDFADAIDMPMEIFIGDIETYETYLKHQHTARWRDLVVSKAYRSKVSLGIIHERAGRLVRPIISGESDHPKIVINSMNRLKIDLLALLRAEGLIVEKNGEISFSGFEPANGIAPLQDFYVYILQEEAVGCVLLRPNSHFSLSDDVRNNQDIMVIRDNKNQCDGMNGMLYIPTPSNNGPNYMSFGGDPGLSKILVLIARWPALPKVLRNKLANPNGADLKLLDDLAANLMPSADAPDPSEKHYWRIFEQRFELVR